MLCLGTMNATQPMLDPHPFKLKIEDFELLQEAGAFEGHKKVQLIQGVLVEVNAEFMRHTRVKNELMIRLHTALIELGSRYYAVVEPTLALPPHNLPRPDVMVSDAPIERDYYRVQHAAIVIEVSDSTLADDLGPKRDMYATQGVGEYWVVSLRSLEVHQFWSPVAGAFGESRLVPLAGEIRSATLPELAIDGRGIL